MEFPNPGFELPGGGEEFQTPGFQHRLPQTPGSNIEFPNPGFELSGGRGRTRTRGSSIEFPKPRVRTWSSRTQGSNSLGRGEEFPNPGFEHRVPEPQGLNIDFKLQVEPGFDKFEPRVQP